MTTMTHLSALLHEETVKTLPNCSFNIMQISKPMVSSIEHLFNIIQALKHRMKSMTHLLTLLHWQTKILIKCSFNIMQISNPKVNLIEHLFALLHLTTIKIAQLLFQLSADIEAQDKDNETPLCIALFRNSGGVAQP